MELEPKTSTVQAHHGATHSVSIASTSRSKTLGFPAGYEWRWILDGTQILVLRLSNFSLLVTEETLQQGNISTHLKLSFDVGSRLHQAGISVTLKLYGDGGVFMYDVPMPQLNVHCRPDHDYKYDSGLILLQQNHFDIIKSCGTDFPHQIRIPFCG
jgi:hypothetical protein